MAANRRSFALVSFVAVTATAPFFSPVVAQRVASMPAVGVTAETRRITVNLTNVPLPLALQAIARQAGLTPVYKSSLLPAGTRVTLHVRDIVVQEVFEQALRGTGLVASVQPTGAVAIMRNVNASTVAGVIVGTVTDVKTKRPVRGAKIGLDGVDRVAETGTDGTFRLAAVEAGTHTVTVKLLGYARVNQKVTVEDNATVSLSVALESSATPLEQVVVTGTVIPTELKAVPNAITVITAKQIEERGITRIDQFFRGEVPGLFSVNLGSASLLDEVTMFSRGASAFGSSSDGVDLNTGGITNAIKTYVDGVEMVDPKYLSHLDPKSIERIEIISGPQASTIYGANAINGVMQIFTKRGSATRPQVTLQLQSGITQHQSSSNLAPAHSADLGASGMEGRWSYNVGVSWGYTGAWTPSKRGQNLTGTGGGRMDLGRLSVDMTERQGRSQNVQRGIQTQSETDLVASGSYRPSATQGLLISQISTVTMQSMGITVSARPFMWWSHQATLGTDAATSENQKNTPTFSAFGRGGDTTLNMNQTSNAQTSQHYNTTLQIPLLPASRLDLTLGGDHTEQHEINFGASPTSLTGNLTNTSIQRSKPSRNTGAFTQGQLVFKDALFLTYGVRMDWNPTFGDKAKVAPGRYGMSYVRDVETPVGPLSVKFRGSYGRSIRPPTEGIKRGIANRNPYVMAVFGPVDYQIPNPELGPETQQGGEGGLELYLGSRVSLSVTRFNQTVDNLVVYVGNVDSVRSLNVAIPGTVGSIGCGESRDADGYCYYLQSEYLNVGSIRNQGWETQGSITGGPFTLRGTYSWTKSRIIGITQKYRSLVPYYLPGGTFDYLPEHTWALGMTYADAGTSISLSVNGVGLLYRGSDALSLATASNVRLQSTLPLVELPSGFRYLGPGYATADLNATHRLSSRVDASLRMTNVTNHFQNDLGASLDAIGRQTEAGLRIRL